MAEAQGKARRGSEPAAPGHLFSRCLTRLPTIGAVTTHRIPREGESGDLSRQDIRCAERPVDGGHHTRSADSVSRSVVCTDAPRSSRRISSRGPDGGRGCPTTFVRPASISREATPASVFHCPLRHCQVSPKGLPSTRRPTRRETP